MECLSAVALDTPTKPLRKLDSSLTSDKDPGRLIYPLPCITKVCEITEQKIFEAKLNNKLYQDTNVLEHIAAKVVSYCLTQYPSLLQKANHKPMHKLHVGKKNMLDIFNLEIQAYWKRKEPGSPKKLPKAQTHKVDITTAPVKLFVLIPHYLKSNNMNLMQYQLI